MSKKYRNYFQINESYFPAVNEDVIRTQPNVWKSYYPHDSFIRLLNQTKSVLTNGQRMSIWVEGAYGTGNFLMMSHINSYRRKRLNNLSPYTVFSMLYGSDIAAKLGITEIPAEEVILTPKLFKK